MKQLFTYLFGFAILGLILGLVLDASIITLLSRYSDLPLTARIQVAGAIIGVCSVVGMGVGGIFYRKDRQIQV